MLWARCCNTWLRFQGLPATTFSASSRSCTACRAWGQPVKVCRSPVQPASGAAASITDVVLSARNISTVFLFRPSTGKIVWLKTGPWLNQHDVDYHGNGNYTIFGND
ncbi:MAG: hypothetical protein IIA03_15585, partial [Proteobacteria bacterium]|nr:hypothetical protein [Pseudomonadota bacterium]